MSERPQDEMQGLREFMFRGMTVSGKWVEGNLSVIKRKLTGEPVEAGHYISNSFGMPFAYQVRPETVTSCSQEAGRLRTDLATAQREMDGLRKLAQVRLEQRATTQRERDNAIKQRDDLKAELTGAEESMAQWIRSYNEVCPQRDALAAQVGEMRGVLTSLLQNVTSSIHNITNRANGGQFVDGERFTLGAARHVKRYLEPLLALTSTQAEQRYKAAEAVVEIAPKMLDICYTSDEHCALCKQNYQQCDEWRMRQALAAYAGAKDGEAK